MRIIKDMAHDSTATIATGSTLKDKEKICVCFKLIFSLNPISWESALLIGFQNPLGAAPVSIHITKHTGLPLANDLCWGQMSQHTNIAWNSDIKHFFNNLKVLSWNDSFLIHLHNVVLFSSAQPWTIALCASTEACRWLCLLEHQSATTGW